MNVNRDFRVVLTCESCGKPFSPWFGRTSVSRCCSPACYGDLLAIPIWDRILKSLDKNGQGGCWLWTGAIRANGYGHIAERGKNWLVHRLVYEKLVGPIPDGLTLDHLCRVRHCANPDHLEPVTVGVNTLRGGSFAARNAQKTHCPKGHPYDEENTEHYKNRRKCKTCRKYVKA